MPTQFFCCWYCFLCCLCLVDGRTSYSWLTRGLPPSLLLSSFVFLLLFFNFPPSQLSFFLFLSPFPPSFSLILLHGEKQAICFQQTVLHTGTEKNHVSVLPGKQALRLLKGKRMWCGQHSGRGYYKFPGNKLLLWPSNLWLRKRCYFLGLFKEIFLYSHGVPEKIRFYGFFLNFFSFSSRYVLSDSFAFCIPQTSIQTFLFYNLGLKI